MIILIIISIILFLITVIVVISSSPSQLRLLINSNQSRINLLFDFWRSHIVPEALTELNDQGPPDASQKY